MLKVGIQLYTVRDLLSSDFTGTLEAISALGYQGVEFAGNYGNTPPSELTSLLKRLGLECCGLHTNMPQLNDPTSMAYQYAHALGARYITTSLVSEVAKDWRATIRQVCGAAQIAADQGVSFTYHNHAGEFTKIDGEYALDMLYQQSDPAVVKAELDTYWIRKGGDDPVSYIRKYANRTPQVHLKDMDPSDESFAEVGEGCIDMAGVLQVARDAGSEWIIVEQDICKRSPLESAKISLENLKRLGIN